MNELQRQHYLSALGVDSYMPRWCLPFAPASVACELPIAIVERKTLDTDLPLIENVVPILPPSVAVKPRIGVAPASPLLNNLLAFNPTQNSQAAPVSAADILAQLGDQKSSTIEAFSLSIWRPADGLMIIDSRNTSLALPTELFLHNVLRASFANQGLKPQEEILRWPMFDKNIAKRTEENARIELQTWLQVQHEIRPIRFLWLMGTNALSYLSPASNTAAEFQTIYAAELGIDLLLLPSLNELLQHPQKKRQLFMAIYQYQLRPQ